MAKKRNYSSKREWRAGLSAGLPICLGYLSVSFGVGILAVRGGMSVLQAALLSASNLTSAGQAAGIGIIAAGGSLFELALSQIVINLRYSLMGLSLSQKLDPSFRTPQRLIASYGITDEIFGVSASREKDVTPPYMYGMILIAAVGWVLGTLLGAVAGEVLPSFLTNALGIMLYGMFLAIIIPPARKNPRLVFVIAAAAGLHLIFHYCIPQVSGGFSVIICGVAAAVLAALFFPVEDEEDPAAGDGDSDDHFNALAANEKEGRPQ